MLTLLKTLISQEVSRFIDNLLVYSYKDHVWSYKEFFFISNGQFFKCLIWTWVIAVLCYLNMLNVCSLLLRLKNIYEISVCSPNAVFEVCDLALEQAYNKYYKELYNSNYHKYQKQ